MSLSPKDLSTLTTVVSTTKTQDYLSLGFYTTYYYHFLITISEEIPAVWPQRWGTGKILFLLTRYLPILLTIQAALAELPVRTTIPPKACEGLWKGLDATTKAGIAFSEITLLVCLHALLGAKRRYLACMILVYITTFVKRHELFPLENSIKSSDTLAHGRGKSHPLPFGEKVWQHMFLWPPAFGSASGTRSLPHFAWVIVPLLASRLLLNMRTTKDPGLQSVVSTILFDSVPGTLGSLEDDQTTIGSIEMARVAGIGRRRGSNKANEDLEQSDVQVYVDSEKWA
ncbi:hypothetical protein D9611_015006 [Ephemerocybe angulata]|uniref:DUF6533 domain-containing protein n=1 Tax=Ephemerocybe angulata TaxID=980116 RepID=A0A8H5ARB3_9AGAR|nr:hypothetical protein D9611_015006 [Tulosesus angulatus]